MNEKAITATGDQIQPLPAECLYRAVDATALPFASFHDPAGCVNQLTGPYRDSIVGAPEYKLTCVQIEPTAHGS